MKKARTIVSVAIAVVVLLASGYVYWQSTQVSSQTLVTASGHTLTIPSRPPEVNGTVLRIEGNELVIKRIISTLTVVEQAAKKAKMQSLSIEERQALKAQESEVAQTEDITVIIPVGVPIVVGTGDMSGAISESSLSDIKIGGNLSIWKTDNDIELVKIKGL